jgi:hypothetical protein
VTGGWRKLHNEVLHNVYSSPSIIRTMMSIRMRWAENVVRIGIRVMYSPTLRTKIHRHCIPLTLHSIIVAYLFFVINYVSVFSTVFCVLYCLCRSVCCVLFERDCYFCDVCLTVVQLPPG